MLLNKITHTDFVSAMPWIYCAAKHIWTLFHLLHGALALSILRELCFSSFLEVLRCETHMDFLKRFLIWHASETPLMFYLAVEDMKKSKDLKQRQNKMTTVLRRFFSETHGRGEFYYLFHHKTPSVCCGVRRTYVDNGGRSPSKHKTFV